MSINAGIRWLGITASVLCAFHSSLLQHKLKNSRLSALMSQSSGISQIKRYDTQTPYYRPAGSLRERLTLVAFAEASHSGVSSQFCYIVGFVFGPIQKG